MSLSKLGILLLTQKVHVLTTTCDSPGHKFLGNPRALKISSNKGTYLDGWVGGKRVIPYSILTLVIVELFITPRLLRS